MKKNVLKGVTWDHSRGFTPMVATAQRFGELHSDIEIHWEKRTLQDFADKPIAQLTKEYDLLVIDHPWAGFAAKNKTLLPLEQYLDKDIMSDLSTHSVGRSFESYSYDGGQWALPIDAAAPVASFRPDLIEEKGIKIPQTYKDLLELAEKGGVVVPAIPIDSLMNFYMFCSTLGEEPFRSKEQIVSKEIGVKALQLHKTLLDKCDTRCFDWNPIKVYEMMTQTDEFVYCPFAYGYVNYAKKGYAPHLLHYGNLVALQGHTLRSTLGGTGIAVSAEVSHTDAAVSYLEYLVSSECQQTLFFNAGGQSAHALAWESEEVNNQCHHFFSNTYSTLSGSYLRPRYNGYLDFQDSGGDVVRNYLLKGGKEDKVLQKLNDLYYSTIR